MTGLKTAIEFVFYGMAAILIVKAIDASPLASLLGDKWYVWFGAGVISALIAKPVANRLIKNGS